MSRFDHRHNLRADSLAPGLGPFLSTNPALPGRGHATIRARPAAKGLHGWSGRLTETLATWDRRRRYRRELAQMDDHLLSDIGLTPGAARAEANKPFWRA